MRSRLPLRRSSRSTGRRPGAGLQLFDLPALRRALGLLFPTGQPAPGQPRRRDLCLSVERPDPRIPPLQDVRVRDAPAGRRQTGRADPGHQCPPHHRARSGHSRAADRQRAHGCLLDSIEPSSRARPPSQDGRSGGLAGIRELGLVALGGCVLLGQAHERGELVEAHPRFGVAGVPSRAPERAPSARRREEPVAVDDVLVAERSSSAAGWAWRRLDHVRHERRNFAADPRQPRRVTAAPRRRSRRRPPRGMRPRRIASSSPSGARASVRPINMSFAPARASTAARIFCTCCSAGITSLPRMWPQRLGQT